MIDINLLPPRDLTFEKENELRSRLIWIALVSGGAILALFLVIFFLGVFATSQVANLEGQRSKLLSNFEADVPKLEMLLSLSDKIKGIKKVRTIRPNLSLAITKLQALSVEGISMSRFSISSSGSLNIDAAARDGTALSSYLANLESKNSRDFFVDLTISGLQSTRDGGFQFVIEAKFDGSKLIGDTQKS